MASSRAAEDALEGESPGAPNDEREDCSGGIQNGSGFNAVLACDWGGKRATSRRWERQGGRVNQESQVPVPYEVRTWETPAMMNINSCLNLLQMERVADVHGRLQYRACLTLELGDEGNTMYRKSEAGDPPRSTKSILFFFRLFFVCLSQARAQG